MICYIRVVVLMVLLFACSLKVGAQDAMFSQPYAAPLLISPSFAGLSYGSRVSLLFRDQWPGVAATYRNYGVSYDTFFEQYNSGVGLMYNRNDQGGGIYVVNDFAIPYSYDIRIARGYYLRPGIKFEYIGRVLDYSKLFYGNQINPDNGVVLGNPNGATGSVLNSKFDAGASVMGYAKWAWIGVSLDHLVKSKIGYTDLGNYNNIKTTAFGGVKFELYKVLSGQTQQTLSFAFQFQNQGGFNQLMLGSYWFLNPLEVGIWYRGIPFEKVDNFINNDAAIFIAGVTLGSFKFAYSYDLALSKLAGYSGGANELTLIWHVSNNFETKSKRRAIPCPGESAGGFGTSKYTNSRRGSHRF